MVAMMTAQLILEALLSRLQCWIAADRMAELILMDCMQWLVIDLETLVAKRSQF